jgi:hypothetical protein
VQKPSPTFFQIISRDYLAQNFFIMIFGGWVIYGIDALFEGRATLFLAVIAAILTPLGLLTFFWRYRLIVSTFVNGVETSGQVTSIETISTGKRRSDYIIHYEYDLHGQRYEFRNRVKKNGYVKTLKQGQKVHLLAHEKTPHIAFIKEIYLETI